MPYFSDAVTEIVILDSFFLKIGMLNEYQVVRESFSDLEEAFLKFWSS